MQVKPTTDINTYNDLPENRRHETGKSVQTTYENVKSLEEIPKRPILDIYNEPESIKSLDQIQSGSTQDSFEYDTMNSPPLQAAFSPAVIVHTPEHETSILMSPIELSVSDGSAHSEESTRQSTRKTLSEMLRKLVSSKDLDKDEENSKSREGPRHETLINKLFHIRHEDKDEAQKSNAKNSILSSFSASTKKDQKRLDHSEGDLKGKDALQIGTKNTFGSPHLAPKPIHNYHDEHLKHKRYATDSKAATSNWSLSSSRVRSLSAAIPLRDRSSSTLREKSASNLRGPTVQEKYGKLDNVLGQGTYATVKLSHRNNLDKCFAVKEFRKKRSHETEKEYEKKLISEFCISSSLKHPNVIETYDLLQDDHGRWCVVMEYCEGGSLFHKISSVGFSGNEEILCYMKQLYRGLQYIHSIGVVHRDLKPENLLLDASGRILKIIDFGVAAVFKTQFEKLPHMLHGVYGSTPYIAPEEWNELGDYNPTKVDVWTTGIILYLMLSKSLLWNIAKEDDPEYLKFLKRREYGYPNFEMQQGTAKTLLYKTLHPSPNERPEMDQLLQLPEVENIHICTGADDAHHQHLMLQHAH